MTSPEKTSLSVEENSSLLGQEVKSNKKVDNSYPCRHKAQPATSSIACSARSPATWEISRKSVEPILEYIGRTQIFLYDRFLRWGQIILY